MNKLFVMMGPAGAGKSTLARMIESSHEDTVIVSRDAIRFAMLEDGDDYFAKEDAVIARFYARINDAMKQHQNVIADATHITKKSRKDLAKHLSVPSRTKVIGVWLDVDPEVAIRQNAKRQGITRVPEDVIQKMYKKRAIPHDEFFFDEITMIDGTSDLNLLKAL